MKKLKLIAIVCIAATMMTGCGNMALGPGNYSFKKVHVEMNGYSCCLDLNSWHENEGFGIEVNVKDYGAMYLSEGTYILVEDNCPICDSKEG